MYTLSHSQIILISSSKFSMPYTALPRCNTIILDIGDVLYSWSLGTSTPLSSRTLKAILTSMTWGQYECGELSEAECYTRISIEHCVDLADVYIACDHIRDSFQPNLDFFSFIRSLKDLYKDSLHIFAMSNISHLDFECLRSRETIDWSIFERVFTSAAAGVRKPDLGFYQRVLSEIGCDPDTTIFVDDKVENVLPAQSLGLHGIVYSNITDVCSSIRLLVDGSPTRGLDLCWVGTGDCSQIDGRVTHDAEKSVASLRPL